MLSPLHRSPAPLAPEVFRGCTEAGMKHMSEHGFVFVTGASRRYTTSIASISRALTSVHGGVVREPM